MSRRASVLGIFRRRIAARASLRIPLDERRRQIEALPWVEHATVRRVLPNQIEVEIAERTPIAFLREPGDLALIDAHGVILDTAASRGNFHFPVVTGIRSGHAARQTAKNACSFFPDSRSRLSPCAPDALDRISEVDLSDDTRFARDAHRFRVRCRDHFHTGFAGVAAHRYARARAFWRQRFCRQISDARRRFKALARRGGRHRVGGPALQPRGRCQSGRGYLSPTAAAEIGRDEVAKAFEIGAAFDQERTAHRGARYRQHEDLRPGWRDGRRRQREIRRAWRGGIERLAQGPDREPRSWPSARFGVPSRKRRRLSVCRSNPR